MGKLNLRNLIKNNLIFLKLLSIPRVRGFIISFRLRRIIRLPIIPRRFQYNFTSQKKVTAYDLEISKRILKFLTVNISENPTPSNLLQNSPWASIVNNQVEFQRIIESNDAHRLASYLLEAPMKIILAGVLQGDSEYAQLKVSSRYRRVQNKIVIQRLIRLGNAVGGEIVQNPEQGQWGLKNLKSFNQLYKNLESKFGLQIEIPDFFTGLFRVDLGRISWNQVEVMSMNSAMQIKNALGGDTSKVVLEIGAGIGYTTFWLKKLGFNSIAIIDLPHVVAVQAFFLMKAFPQSKIYLHGESKWDNEYEIAIFPNTISLDQIPLMPNLVFNQDSFAEMSISTTEIFLSWISSFSRILFYSINHETEATYDKSARSQVNITKLMNFRENFRLKSRVPNWIREGYVDQIWEIK